MLLTRPPLSCPRRNNSARLACIRHAASVRPEPGSNSPIKRSSYLNSLLKLTYFIRTTSPSHKRMLDIFSISQKRHLRKVRARCSVFKEQARLSRPQGRKTRLLQKARHPQPVIVSCRLPALKPPCPSSPTALAATSNNISQPKLETQAFYSANFLHRFV